MFPAVLALAITFGACSADDSTGRDPDAGATPTPPPMPSEVPAAEGTVATAHIAMVMDTGTPELCLGAVAESYPPQCGGPEIVGWDWAEHGRDLFDRVGKVRWGQFHLVGQWDGASFTVEEAVPAALYDPMAETPSALPDPSSTHEPARLEQVANELRELPGSQGAYADGSHVLVDVTYDDGSLQAWADTVYGSGVVVVSSQLVDQDR